MAAYSARNAPARGARKWSRSAPSAPLPGTKSSLLVAIGEQAETQMRQAVILCTLVKTPEVVLDFLHELEGLECTDPDHAMICDVLLRLADDAPETLGERIHDAIGSQTLENLMSLRHVAISPSVRNPGDTDLAKLTLAEEFAKLEAARGLSDEIEEAESDLTESAHEAMTWRLREAAETRNRAMRSGQEDQVEYEVGTNGARINRDERNAFDALLNKIGYSKPGE